MPISRGLKQIISSCCMIFFVILSGCAQTRGPYAAPTLLPGTDRSMLTPGHWISRHSSPDLLVLTGQQIAELNRHIEKDLKTVSDITRIPIPYPSADVVAIIQQDVSRLNIKGTDLFILQLCVLFLAYAILNTANFIWQNNNKSVTIFSLDYTTLPGRTSKVSPEFQPRNSNRVRVFSKRDVFLFQIIIKWHHFTCEF
jgi:hypothetical protein